MKYLVDSNIIIYHLNGEKIATKFLKNFKEEIAISQITYVEVLSFKFTLEQERIVKKFLEEFKILDIDSKVAQKAVEFRKLKKIKLPDNLIASTAKVYDLILVTRNTKDFKSFNIPLLNPFE